MVRPVKEEIKDFPYRYCVIGRYKYDDYYTVEEFSFSLDDAQENASRYKSYDLRQGDKDTEYWAFDTKKWKAFPPKRSPQKQVFDDMIRIYKSREDGSRELLKNFINREVAKATGGIQKF